MHLKDKQRFLQLLKLPDGTVKVLVEGFKRVKIIDFRDEEKFISCTFEYQNDILPTDDDLMPLALASIKRLEKLTSINKKISNETINNIKQLKDPSKISDNIASHLNATISERQKIFEVLLELKGDKSKKVNKVLWDYLKVVGILD